MTLNLVKMKKLYGIKCNSVISARKTPENYLYIHFSTNKIYKTNKIKKYSFMTRTEGKKRMKEKKKKKKIKKEDVIKK